MTMLNRTRRRVLHLLVLVLVFALAVPASAAVWRATGTVTSNGNSQTFDLPSPSLGTGSNSVEDIQFGFYAWTGMKVEWDADWTCWNASGGYASRSRSGSTWVPAKTWKWVNLRASTVRRAHCDYSVFAYGGKYRSLKLRTRVR